MQTMFQADQLLGLRHLSALPLLNPRLKNHPRQHYRQERTRLHRANLNPISTPTTDADADPVFAASAEVGNISDQKYQLVRRAN